MKKVTTRKFKAAKLLVLGCLLTASLFILGACGADSPEKTLEKTALQTVEYYTSGQYEEMVAMFANVGQPIKAADMENAWKELEASFGKLVKVQKKVRLEAIGDKTAAFVPCKFEKDSLEFEMIFNQEGKMTAFFYVPSTDSKTAQ